MAFASDCIGGNEKCPTPTPVIFITQGGTNTVEFVVVDRYGAPVNLTPYSDPPSVAGEKHGVYFMVKDMLRSTLPIIDKKCEIITAEDGVAKFSYTSINAPAGGIWVGQAILWENGGRKGIAPYYVEIAPTIDVLTTQYTHPLTIPEIRLAMRDKCDADNFLLDDVEFTDTEIAWAIRRRKMLWRTGTPGKKHACLSGIYPLFRKVFYETLIFRWFSAI